MIERYDLNTDALPTLPTPHDCIVTRMQQEDQFIVFYFENDISGRDSIKAIHPQAKTLIIRYHLTKYREFTFHKWYRGIRLLFPSGFYKQIDKPNLDKLVLPRLEYLYHHVSYCSIITTLFSDGYMILDANVDYVEFEWIE